MDTRNWLVTHGIDEESFVNAGRIKKEETTQKEIEKISESIQHLKAMRIDTSWTKL